MRNDGLAQITDTLSRSAEKIANAGSETQVKKELIPDLAQQLVDLPAYRRDRLIYRMVVGTLGIAVILVLVIQGLETLLPGQDGDVPEGLIAIGSAAIGALAGLLAPSPS